jgi:hypothetical protein
LFFHPFHFLLSISFFFNPNPFLPKEDLFNPIHKWGSWMGGQPTATCDRIAILHGLVAYNSKVEGSEKKGSRTFCFDKENNFSGEIS